MLILEASHIGACFGDNLFSGNLADTCNIVKSHYRSRLIGVSCMIDWCELHVNWHSRSLHMNYVHIRYT